MTVNSKLSYFATAAIRKMIRTTTVCPSCKSRESAPLATKYFVTELRRCSNCRLQFRTPTVSAVESDQFYQNTYSVGFTTDLPSDEELNELMAARFRGTTKDYSAYLTVLDALGVPIGARVFDFGCSWGYGTWQLREGGFEVEAFEVSRRRAAYARTKLGLTVYDQLPAPIPSFDVFFSAHVLEHVPCVADSIEYGLACLKPGGLFVAFTPNGSSSFRAASPWNWFRSWGLVHPNCLDDEYYGHALRNSRYAVASRPYPLSDLRGWSARREVAFRGVLSGDELLAVGVAP